MRPVLDDDDVVHQYRSFADTECGTSSIYAALARAFAADDELMDRLSRRPRAQRQPNLVFAALRTVAGPVADPWAGVGLAHRHWDRIVPLLATRRTQTNELARCASFLPALALLPGPLALLELGASAGLCLVPERWDHRYRGDVVADVLHTVGAGGVEVDCMVTMATDGGRPDLRMPIIRWRRGMDLNPLDCRDPQDTDWLTMLVWPEHEERRRRLAAGLANLAPDPPPVVAGDIVTDLEGLLEQVPDGLTVVVQHSAVLAYLDRDDRAHVVRTIRRASRPGRAVHRLGQEGARVLPDLQSDLLEAADRRGWFALSLDDEVLGICAPHGGELLWRGRPRDPVTPEGSRRSDGG